MAKDKRIGLVATSFLDARLRKEAKRQGRSLNDLICYCCELYLDCKVMRRLKAKSKK